MYIQCRNCSFLINVSQTLLFAKFDRSTQSHFKKIANIVLVLNLVENVLDKILKYLIIIIRDVIVNNIEFGGQLIR